MVSIIQQHARVVALWIALVALVTTVGVASAACVIRDRVLESCDAATSNLHLDGLTQGQSIVAIRPGAFQSAPLRSLTLRNMPLNATAIPPMLWTSVNTTLTSVVLSNVSLTTPLWCQGMPAVDLRLYFLASPLDPNLLQCEGRVIKLTVGPSEATSIPETFLRHQQHVQELNVFSIDASVLPAHLLDGMMSLTTLKLSRLSIRSLPATLFQGVPQLSSISISEMEIMELPSELLQPLVSIQMFSVSSTQLRFLPDQLAKDLAERAIKVGFSSNQITAIPYGFISTMGDRLTSISGNPLQYAPCATGSTSGGVCSSWPSGCLRNGTQLLSCSSPPFGTLMLQNFNITSVAAGAFRDLSITDTLDLSRNQLTSILPATFQATLVGNTLNLNNNNVGVLQPSALQGLAVSSLTLTSNPNLFVPATTLSETTFITTVVTSPSNCSVAGRGQVSWKGGVVCSECPRGSYCPAGLQSPVACPAGTYQSSMGKSALTDCAPCSVGTFSDTVGATTATSCVLCPAGLFNNATGGASLQACSPCAAGTANAIPGRPLCDRCAAGQYQPSEQSVRCIECGEGTYGPTSGATTDAACIPCPSSSPHSSPGSNHVSACSATSGTHCAPGWAVAPPLTTCQLCPPGHSCEGGVDAVARQCVAGSFAFQGAASCTLCPMGTFSTVMGAPSPLSCQRCPNGTFTASAGMQACQPCGYGFARSASQSTCQVCSANEVCLAGATSPLSPEARAVASTAWRAFEVVPISAGTSGDLMNVEVPALSTFANTILDMEERNKEDTLVFGVSSSLILLVAAIAAGAIATLVLAGHAKLPLITTRGDLFAKDHMLSSGMSVVFKPTRLGAACSVWFALLAVLVMWALATSPNASFTTGLVANGDAAPFGAARASMTIQLRAFGPMTGTQCSGTMVNVDIVGMNGTLATSVAPSSSNDSACVITIHCTECQLTATTTMLVNMPWSFQLFMWHTLSRSTRTHSQVAGAVVASPNALLVGTSNAELSWTPSYLVDTTSSLRSVASATASLQSSSPQSQVVSTGLMLQYRSGSVTQQATTHATVNEEDKVSFRLTMSRADVSHQTVVSDTLSWTQRASNMLSAVMSLLGFMAVVFKIAEACKRKIMQYGYGHHTTVTATKDQRVEMTNPTWNSRNK